MFVLYEGDMVKGIGLGNLWEELGDLSYVCE